MHAIQHQPGGRRFQTTVDGQDAHLDYVLDRDVVVITHTIVPNAIGGRGIAGELVRAALDHARQAGLKVNPACSYADAWIRRHPDYTDLLDS
ncbi:MAG: GNAT family N-acetyltransferase [Pseudomonadota bacterium]|nr:GNAT family N-acetyltransferase [Pseudomonadota bacterium]